MAELTAEQKYPYEDWQYDVANGDTKLGYAEWVRHNVESHKDDVEAEDWATR